MRVARDAVTREQVVKFYSAYDRRKKEPGKVDALLSEMERWEWDDPDCLDMKLADNGLKRGVLTAYRTWQLVEFGLLDLLECAIVNHIFPGESQSLGRLLLRGRVAEWFPKGDPVWFRQIGSGLDLDERSALIMRKALPSEAPARWYIEDGSGRALALLQRILRYAENGRTGWAYRGDQPDERSRFMKDHPGLMR